MNAETWTNPLIQRSKVFGLTYVQQTSSTSTLSRTLTYLFYCTVLSVAKLLEHYYRINSKRYYFNPQKQMHRLLAESVSYMMCCTPAMSRRNNPNTKVVQKCEIQKRKFIIFTTWGAKIRCWRVSTARGCAIYLTHPLHDYTEKYVLFLLWNHKRCADANHQHSDDEEQ